MIGKGKQPLKKISRAASVDNSGASSSTAKPTSDGVLTNNNSVTNESPCSHTPASTTSHSVSKPTELETVTDNVATELVVSQTHTDSAQLGTGSARPDTDSIGPSRSFSRIDYQALSPVNMPSTSQVRSSSDSHPDVSTSSSSAVQVPDDSFSPQNTTLVRSRTMPPINQSVNSSLIQSAVIPRPVSQSAASSRPVSQSAISPGTVSHSVSVRPRSRQNTGQLIRERFSSFVRATRRLFQPNRTRENRRSIADLQRRANSGHNQEQAPLTAPAVRSLFATCGVVLSLEQANNWVIYPVEQAEVSDESPPSTSGTSLSPHRRPHTTVDYFHHLMPDLRKITSCGFYWGVMDRYEAEELLENKPEGTFLLRDSMQDDFLFSVSFRRYGRSLHARIEQWEHQFSFDAHESAAFRAPFVTQLIEHYKDPQACMFFEPMLTQPLNRPKAFSLQQLARAVVCDHITYDSIDSLAIPKHLQDYLRYYHYKQKLRVRTHSSNSREKERSANT